MFRRVLCVALFGALALLVPSAHAGIMHDGAKDDPAWQQEYVALGQQYDSVVALYGHDGSSWRLAGSGVVISDHHVIGAAHVAKYNTYGAVMGNKTSEWWAHYETTSVTVHPLYTGIGSTDLAIWTFSDTITSDKVAAARLYTGDDSALLGTLGDFAGFGWYGYPSTGLIAADGAKRGCQNIVDMLGYPPSGYGTDQFVMSFDGPGSPQYQHLGGRVADLDSGGGWFINGESEPTLFAVNDWRTITSEYGSAVSGATSVSQHIDWIQSVSGVPEPGTIVMFASGAVAFLLLSFRRKRRV